MDIDVKNILMKFIKYDVCENDINDDTDIIEDLNLDSLSLIEFITELEITFNIEFTSDEFESLFKYKDLLEIINQKSNKL